MLTAVSLCLPVAAVWAAAYPTTQPYEGIRYGVEVREDPPLRLFVARVELTHPRVGLHVSPGGADPDGAGEWETTLMRPTRIAQRDRLDLVVNGDFFEIQRSSATQSAPAAYRSEIWAAAIGPAVTNGEIWSVGTGKTPCLIVLRDRGVMLADIDRPPPGAWAVVAGNRMMVENCRALRFENKLRHPRTAVGLDAKREVLTILVVDGRRPGVSIGMSYDELADEMLRRGCHWALNLDGGGSSVMALRDPQSGELRILNGPSDGRERPVANVLGVRFQRQAN